MQKRLTLFITGFLLFLIQLNAQSDSLNHSRMRDNFSLRDKLVWGGNVGLQFGSQSLIDVSPIAGYKLTERLVPGVGITYRHISWRQPGYQPVRANFYGGSAWLRYYVIPQIFAHAEYEALNGEWEPYMRPGHRYFLTTPFLGLGYSQGAGNGGLASYIMLLYILNYSYDSPYGSPFVFRVGFTFGI